MLYQWLVIIYSCLIIISMFMATTALLSADQLGYHNTTLLFITLLIFMCSCLSVWISAFFIEGLNEPEQGLLRSREAAHQPAHCVHNPKRALRSSSQMLLVQSRSRIAGIGLVQNNLCSMNNPPFHICTADCVQSFKSSKNSPFYLGF